MKKTNKAVSGIAALTIAASALSGCGNAGGGKTKITLMTIKDYYTTALNEIAKDYNKKNPDTQIEIQVIGDNGTYSQNFITKITMDKKTAPDIIHTNLISGNSEGDMITKNWLLPLDDFLEEENPYNNGKKVKDAFTDPVFLTQAVSSVGKVGYLPFDCVSVGCYYNKTIFEANNIEVPATYEDFARALEKLRQAGYKNPLGATAYVDWFGASLADWGFRKMETQFLTLPGDALYNEETMKANTEIVYDKDDPNFDVGAVFNDEKIVAYIDIFAELKRVDVFVFVGLKSVLPDDELALLYRHCELKKIALLLIESHRVRPPLAPERSIIITDDLCEIVENFG